MPKELFEIKGFHKGIQGNASSEDLHQDSASYSKDVETFHNAGSIEGRDSESVLMDTAGTPAAHTELANTEDMTLLEHDGKHDAVYKTGTSLKYKKDIYGATHTHGTKTVNSNSSAVFAHHNKEVHVGLGSQATDSPKWIGYTKFKQWSLDEESEANLPLFEDAHLKEMEKFTDMYKTVTLGDYMYGIEWQGNYIYKFLKSTGEFLKRSEFAFNKLQALCLYRNGYNFAYNTAGTPHGDTGSRPVGKDIDYLWVYDNDKTTPSGTNAGTLYRIELDNLSYVAKHTLKANTVINYEHTDGSESDRISGKAFVGANSVQYYNKDLISDMIHTYSDYEGTLGSWESRERFALVCTSYTKSLAKGYTNEATFSNNDIQTGYTGIGIAKSFYNDSATVYNDNHEPYLFWIDPTEFDTSTSTPVTATANNLYHGRLYESAQSNNGIGEWGNFEQLPSSNTDWYIMSAYIPRTPLCQIGLAAGVGMAFKPYKDIQGSINEDNTSVTRDQISLGVRGLSGGQDTGEETNKVRVANPGNDTWELRTHIVSIGLIDLIDGTDNANIGTASSVMGLRKFYEDNTSTTNPSRSTNATFTFGNTDHSSIYDVFTYIDNYYLYKKTGTYIGVEDEDGNAERGASSGYNGYVWEWETDHNLSVGDAIMFIKDNRGSANSADPNNFYAKRKVYYVVQVPASHEAVLSETPGGTPLDPAQNSLIGQSGKWGAVKIASSFTGQQMYDYHLLKLGYTYLTMSGDEERTKLVLYPSERESDGEQAVQSIQHHHYNRNDLNSLALTCKQLDDNPSWFKIHIILTGSPNTVKNSAQIIQGRVEPYNLSAVQSHMNFDGLFIQGSNSGKILRFSAIPASASIDDTYKRVTDLSASLSENEEDSSILNNKKIFYKFSFMYDKYQEGLLSNEYTMNTLTTSKEVELDLNLYNLSSLNKRVTSIQVYSAYGDSSLSEKPNTPYRFVESIPLDTRWLYKSWENNIQSRNLLVIDTGKRGATYSSRTELPESLTTMSLNWGLSTHGNSYHFVSDVTIIGEGDDFKNYVFKSKTERFNQFDWTTDFVVLPEKLTALKFYNGRLYAFSSNNTYRINPEGMYIEDTFDGIGCAYKSSVISTEYGMCYCDRNNIYLHNGKNPTPIGDPILNITYSGEKGYQSYFATDSTPIVTFDAKRRAFIVIVHDQMYIYDALAKSWNIWSKPTGLTSAMIEKNGLITIADATNLKTVATDSTTKKVYTWVSQKINLGTSTQLKVIKRVRIGKETTDLSGLGATKIVQVNGQDPTFTHSAETETGSYKINSDSSVKKGTYFQTILDGITGNKIIESISYIFRRKAVK